MDQVYPELKELYEVMEVNFNPLTLCHKIPSVIEFITEKSQLRPYSQALKKVAAVRMVEQVCISIHPSQSPDHHVRQHAVTACACVYGFSLPMCLS